MNRTITILNSPWAITESKMEEILDVYQDRLTGKKRDLEIIAAQMGKPLDNPDQGYTVTDSGVAVIPIVGVMGKRMNLFSQISGGASTDLIGRDLKAALADPAVKAIVLDVDSPGGEISGLSALSALVRNNRDEKCVVAYANGLMCSAAYWVGSAASTIVAEPTAQIGSIGVLTVHRDLSKADEMAGVKRTYLSAGKYKTLGNDAEPLSDFARQSIQERLDDAYTAFVDTVAENRGVTAEKVLADMADGRVFTGQKAISAGLVDSLGTLDDAIEMALDMSEQMKEAKTPSRKGGAMQIQGAALKSSKEEHMDKFTTLAELVAAYPDFAAQLREEGVRSVDLTVPAKAATDAETARIIGLSEAHFGKDIADKFAAVVRTGVTVEQYGAITGGKPQAIIGAATAESEQKQKILEGLGKTGAQDIGTDQEHAQTAKAEWPDLVAAYQKENSCSRSQAIKAVEDKHPGLREKYLDRLNAGTKKEAAHV